MGSSARPMAMAEVFLTLQSKLALESCTLSHNFAAFGGGIDNHGVFGSTMLNVTNCTFSQNFAAVEGGAILNDGLGGSATLTIINSTFSQNSTGNFGTGGAISNDG